MANILFSPFEDHFYGPHIRCLSSREVSLPPRRDQLGIQSNHHCRILVGKFERGIYELCECEGAPPCHHPSLTPWVAWCHRCRSLAILCHPSSPILSPLLDLLGGLMPSAILCHRVSSTGQGAVADAPSCLTWVGHRVSRAAAGGAKEECQYTAFL